MYKSLVSFALLMLLSCSHAAARYPADVQAFIDDAQECQHLAGEWDPEIPQSQQREIEKQVDIVCTRAKSQRGVLKERYHNHTDIIDAIDRFDF